MSTETFNDMTKRMETDIAKRREDAKREDQPRRPQPVIEKDGWGPGPWQNEPDRVDWRHVGLPCFIQRNDHMGNWCGYVGVPPGHPAWEKFYDDVNVDVHGGLTYANKCSGHLCHEPLPGEPNNVWWLGFDMAHAFDYVPGMAATVKKSMPERYDYAGLHSMEEYKTLEYARAETNQLAEQLAAMNKS